MYTYILYQTNHASAYLVHVQILLKFDTEGAADDRYGQGNEHHASNGAQRAKQLA
jgi:hypothetical protein